MTPKEEKKVIELADKVFPSIKGDTAIGNQLKKDFGESLDKKTVQGVVAGIQLMLSYLIGADKYTKSEKTEFSIDELLIGGGKMLAETIKLKNSL